MSAHVSSSNGVAANGGSTASNNTAGAATGTGHSLSLTLPTNNNAQNAALGPAYSSNNVLLSDLRNALSSASSQWQQLQQTMSTAFQLLQQLEQRTNKLDPTLSPMDTTPSNSNGNKKKKRKADGGDLRLKYEFESGSGGATPASLLTTTALSAVGTTNATSQPPVRLDLAQLLSGDRIVLGKPFQFEETTGSFWKQLINCTDKVDTVHCPFCTKYTKSGHNMWRALSSHIRREHKEMLEFETARLQALYDARQLGPRYREEKKVLLTQHRLEGLIRDAVLMFCKFRPGEAFVAGKKFMTLEFQQKNLVSCLHVLSIRPVGTPATAPGSSANSAASSSAGSGPNSATQMVITDDTLMTSATPNSGCTFSCTRRRAVESLWNFMTEWNDLGPMLDLPRFFLFFRSIRPSVSQTPDIELVDLPDLLQSVVYADEFTRKHWRALQYGLPIQGGNPMYNPHQHPIPSMEVLSLEPARYNCICPDIDLSQPLSNKPHLPQCVIQVGPLPDPLLPFVCPFSMSRKQVDDRFRQLGPLPHAAVRVLWRKQESGCFYSVKPEYANTCRGFALSYQYAYHPQGDTRNPLIQHMFHDLFQPHEEMDPIAIVQHLQYMAICGVPPLNVASGTYVMLKSRFPDDTFHNLIVPSSERKVPVSNHPSHPMSAAIATHLHNGMPQMSMQQNSHHHMHHMPMLQQQQLQQQQQQQLAHAHVAHVAMTGGATSLLDEADSAYVSQHAVVGIHPMTSPTFAYRTDDQMLSYDSDDALL